MRLTFSKDLIPLIMKTQTRHQARKRAMPRLKARGPPSSTLSEAFRVCGTKGTCKGVACSHSGSGRTWLWTGLLDKINPPSSPTAAPCSFFCLSIHVPPFYFLLFPSLFVSLPLLPHQSHWSSFVRDRAATEQRRRICVWFM